MNKTSLALLIALAIALPAIAAAQPAPHELPEWWVIDNRTALNIGYPEIGSCGLSAATFVRVKFWLPLGPIAPEPGQIEDPQWGDSRLHTAWDSAWATIYGGNHVDQPDGRLEFRGGGWHLTWFLDVPLDASDPFAFTAYSARLVNAWVDFAPPPAAGKVFILSWQCRSGVPLHLGFEREDLPEFPPPGLLFGRGGPC